MTTAAEELQGEFEDFFLSDDRFSEAITYTPLGASALSIRAVVYRKGHRSQAQRFARGSASDQVEYAVEIRVSSSATAGVVAPQRGDTVTLPIELGLMAKTVTVDAITDRDPGTWRLGLRV